MKVTISFLLLLLISFHSTLSTHNNRYANQPYTPSSHESVAENIAKVTFISAVVASCGYLVYKIGSWLFTKSNVQVFQEALHYYKRTKNEYKNLITTWSQKNSYQSEEQFLASLLSNETSTTYSIETSLQILDREIKTLSDRCEKFNNHTHSEILLYKMLRLLDKMKELHDHLKPIHSYHSKHKDFFHLVQKIRELDHYYKHEINALEQHRNDEQRVNKLLTSHIMSSAKKNRYPYIHYIDTLSNNLNELEKKLKSCQHSYPNVERSAYQLKEYLECIHSLILIHTAYHTELQERERVRLKEQRLALERAHVEAQQAQTRALEEQNWLRRQELYNQKQIVRKLNA